MSRRCLRHCLVTVEAGCQEEVQQKAEKKRRQRRKEERETSLEGNCSRSGCGHREKGKGADRCQADRTKNQLGKVSSKMGTVRKSKMEKRRKSEDWQKGEQMEMQWVEDEKLQEIFER